MSKPEESFTLNVMNMVTGIVPPNHEVATKQSPNRPQLHTIIPEVCKLEHRYRNRVLAVQKRTYLLRIAASGSDHVINLYF
mmetsp:Transcript_1514/g.2718  ORF Transcript_1514/g.2718 Transcript_1514/m.2718 type:complete len:81 (+) Transcript_1514:1438-1680(+)